VLMFPEGTRSADGEVHEFKSGAGYLAMRSGCDVLPLRIRGTHAVLGKGHLIPRRHPVEIRIGSVITNSELRQAGDENGAGGYRKISDLMRNEVLSLGERTPRRISGSRSETPAGKYQPPDSPARERGSGRASSREGLTR
ncbi:MAG: lysophospholipid acyltransferase family protein, partial [Candidatus Binataceae bacterium]